MRVVFQCRTKSESIPGFWPYWTTRKGFREVLLRCIDPRFLVSAILIGILVIVFWPPIWTIWWLTAQAVYTLRKEHRKMTATPIEVKTLAFEDSTIEFGVAVGTTVTPFAYTLSELSRVKGRFRYVDGFLEFETKSGGLFLFRFLKSDRKPILQVLRKLGLT